jgi:hypothetical protein
MIQRDTSLLTGPFYLYNRTNKLLPFTGMTVLEPYVST